jgi:hypothetical protein
MYAERKQWPLRGVEMRLAHSRIHAEDCAECGTKGGMLDNIEAEITLVGELSDEQRHRLLEMPGSPHAGFRNPDSHKPEFAGCLLSRATSWQRPRCARDAAGVKKYTG